MKSKLEKKIGNISQNLFELKPYDGFLSLCKSSHTKENYHQDLRILKQFFDISNIATPLHVQPEHMVHFAASLTKPGITPSGKPRKAYSTRTMRRILASTRSFYRYLASIQHIATDPTAVFHNFAIRSPQRNPRPLPPKDREALVRSLQMDDLEAQKISLTILLGFHCGLRVSEIAHLRIRDLDLTRGLLTVIGKGDKERMVPMTETLKELLKLYLKQIKKDVVHLFTSPRSEQKPIHPDYLERWVKKAAQWAKLENPEELTVHVLRHSFGTQLAESGASVYEIRDLMGHSSIMVSENYVKLASTKTLQAHRRAFENVSGSHLLNLVINQGVASVLDKYRSMNRKS